MPAAQQRFHVRHRDKSGEAPHGVVAGSEYIGLPAFQGFLYLGRPCRPFAFGAGRKGVHAASPACRNCSLFLSFMAFFPALREQAGDFRLRLRGAHAVHGEDAPRERRAVSSRRSCDLPH